MKRFVYLTIVLGVLFVAFMASCTKEGIYNPEKKIQRVYNDDTYTIKYLSQIWNWDGKLLKSIYHYSSSGDLSYTEAFTYEGGRLIRVNDYRHLEYATYDYDGSVLKTYNYYKNNQLSSTLNFTYDGRKVSQVVYTVFGDKEAEKHLTAPLPAAIRERMDVLAAKADATKGLRVITYQFTWTNGNLTGIVGTAGDEKVTFTLTYDNKENPFKGYLNLDGTKDPVYFYSKNNVTQFKENYLNGDNDIYNFSYQYDSDGYPTKAIRTRAGSEYSHATYYVYDK